jgi:hypothetical protein
MEETIIETHILQYFVSNNKNKYDCDLCISENKNFNDDLENVYTHILLYHYLIYLLNIISNSLNF